MKKEIDPFLTRLVICGDYHQFMNWLRADKYYGKNAIYVKDFQDLAGRDREKVEIIKYGLWFDNHKAIEAIEKWLGVKI